MFTEVGPTDTKAVQASARARVAWREVVLFGLLAYGLAWAWSGFWLLLYLGDVLTRSTTPADLVDRLGAVTVLPTMLAPVIAALIMRLFVSKEGLKGSLGLLRPWKYYLAALVVPAVFATAVMLMVQVLGLGEFRWSEASWLVYLMLALSALPVTLSTFEEEAPRSGVLGRSHSPGPTSMSLSASALLSWGIIRTSLNPLIIHSGRALPHGGSYA